MARTYPRLRSCLLSHIQLIVALTAAGIAGAVAEQLPERVWSESLVLPAPQAAAATVFFVVFLGMLLLDFAWWRRRRNKRGKPADRSESRSE